MYIKLCQNEQVLKTSSSPSPTVNMFLSAPESSSCAAGEMLGIPVGVTVVNGWMMRVFKRSLIARPLKRKKITLSFDENCCSFSCREPTTWPANNCQQIMVCSCKMSSYCVWLQIIFCSCVNETTLFSFLESLLAERFVSRRYSLKNKLADRMIKQYHLVCIIILINNIHLLASV